MPEALHRPGESRRVGRPGGAARTGGSGDGIALGARPDTPTYGVGLLDDEGWVHLDLNRGTFQRWQADELVLEVDLSDDIPTGMFTMGPVLDTTEDHVLAIVSDVPGFPVGHALVIDHADGDVVGFFDPDADVRGPRTFGRFVGDDRVLTYHALGTIGLWTLRGEPSPGHVNVPNASYGFDASPDGEVIAVPQGSGPIWLLDRDGSVIGELTGVSPLAFDVEFIGDDRLLSRHFDGGTRLWDLSRQQLSGTLVQTAGTLAPLWSMTVDDVTGDLLHPHSDGLLRVGLEPEDWLSAACDVVARGLHTAEIEAVAPGWTPVDPCGHGVTTANATSLAEDA